MDKDDLIELLNKSEETKHLVSLVEKSTRIMTEHLDTHVILFENEDEGITISLCVQTY